MDMMEARLRMMAMQGQNAGEFIDFDGTFYFNTMYIPTAHTNVEVVFSADNSSGPYVGNPIFGSRKDASTNQLLAWATIDSNSYMRVQRYKSAGPADGSFRYVLDPVGVYTIDTGAKTMSKKGVGVTRTFDYGDTYRGSDYSLFVGAINNGGQPLSTLRFIGKIYRFIIYEGENITAKYIPFRGELKDIISGNVLTKIS